MKYFRTTSQRLFHIFSLLVCITLPLDITFAAPVTETKTALFAAG